MTELDNNRIKAADDTIRLEELLFLCISKWRWFGISLLLALGIAFLYLKKTPPAYLRTASILIKEDSNGKSLSGDAAAFSELGMFQTNTNVNNEIISLKSPAIMLDVVRRLHLDTDYSLDGRFHRQTLYGSTLPVRVSFMDLADSEPAGLTVRLLGEGRLELSGFYRNGEETGEDSVLEAALNDTLDSPLGKITVTPSAHYRGEMEEAIRVTRSGLYAAGGYYASLLNVMLSDEKASVIDLAVRDVSIQRAEDILHTLITVYNENWVKDKNQIAVSTSLFIRNRLAVIEQELGNVDDDISSYKSRNLLPDVQVASNIYMAQSSEVSSRMLTLNNQLYMAQYIRSYLTNKSNENQLLPANSGMESTNIENQISEYNASQLQRNSLIANSSERNPLVIDLDQSLAAMRKAIVSSIDNWVVTLNAQIRNLQQREQQTTARIAASPTQAKYLLSVERQQKVKESLYLYLLQKREENELSQAFTAYNTRIVTPPGGSMSPVSPQKKNIFPIAFAIGLLLPAGILFLKENMNSTLRGRKDLEGMSIPFLGEIPLACQKKKTFLVSHNRQEERMIAVKEKNRDMINEAFRVLRTNLEFMIAREGNAKVIMISSLNQGSGKTFITANLAVSLAIKGKRVLAIDLDMRRASFSAYVQSPGNGVSNYLIGNCKADTIIVRGKIHPNVDVIPVGTVPPNPAELLFSERLEQLLNQLRSRYDYIFIDCPPVEIVADASIINKLAEMTLFVVRAGLLERSLLPEVESFYTAQKYKNMALVLNGTSQAKNRYGYHYGYGGGYTNNK